MREAQSDCCSATTNKCMAAGFPDKRSHSILLGLASNKCIAAGFSYNISQSILSRLACNKWMAAGFLDKSPNESYQYR